MTVFVVMIDPRHAIESLGLLPSMLDDADPRSAKTQFNANYAHGGGWQPTPGFKMRSNGRLLYPGDPPLIPFAMTKLRDEVIMFYPHAFVCILQKDGSFEVARMD